MSGILTLFSYMPYMLEGLIFTLTLVSGGLLIGFFIGLPIAVLYEYYGSQLKPLITLYTMFFRGVPLLVLLYLFYWGILPLIGFKASSLVTSIIVLGFRSGAYQSKIFRSALISIPNGQIEAGEALGMSRIQIIIHVIIPQCLRISLPMWSNEYSIILKDSAICFILGVMEILTRARFVVAATDTAFIPYLFAGLSLMILSYMGIKIISIVYSRIRIPGLMVAGLE